MRRALGVIDLEDDFSPTGTFMMKFVVAELIRVINLLMNCNGYDYRAASTEQHPDNARYFVENNPGMKEGDEILLGGILQKLWRRHCPAGKPGSGFIEGFDKHLLNLIVNKGLDEFIHFYSAFASPHLPVESRKNPTDPPRIFTGLGSALKEYGVTDIDFVGLAFDFCVFESARHAVQLHGLNTRILRCGTALAFPEREEEIREKCEKLGIVVVDAPVEQIITDLGV